jgi:hypothetical protein
MQVCGSPTIDLQALQKTTTFSGGGDRSRGRQSHPPPVYLTSDPPREANGGITPPPG